MSDVTEKLVPYALSQISDVQPVSPLRLKNAPPLFEKLWRVALKEIEDNYCIDTPYGVIYSAGNAGQHFLARIFNRDVGYSGLLGMNAIYPEKMLSSMKIIRRVRLELGWLCPRDRAITGIPNVVIEDLCNHDFIVKHLKASPINKTDDVLWLWCVDDLLERMGNPRAEWEWLYETGLICFEQLYDPFWDEADGLYYGQPTFIDVGGTGYPAEMGPLRDAATSNHDLWVKASSTNALYYKGLQVMAKAARILGKEQDAAAYDERAEKLAAAMREKLRFPDGTFAYFKYPDGRLEQRLETLAAAFPVLTGVVTGEDARKAVEPYPFTPWGAPLLHPFYDRDDFYHNNSAWPFASTFLSWAIEKATGVSHADENLLMLLNAVKDGCLCEVFDLRDNHPCGCPSQLWTDAAFINACARKGWIDLPGLAGPV